MHQVMSRRQALIRIEQAEADRQAAPAEVAPVKAAAPRKPRAAKPKSKPARKAK